MSLLVNFLHIIIKNVVMKPAELTQTISDTLPKLRKSEPKVPDLVLKQPLRIIKMMLSSLRSS